MRLMQNLYTFNRTIVELKWRVPDDVILLLCAFNRTIVELK